MWDYWFKHFSPQYKGLPSLGSIEKIYNQADVSTAVMSVLAAPAAEHDAALAVDCMVPALIRYHWRSAGMHTLSSRGCSVLAKLQSYAHTDVCTCADRNRNSEWTQLLVLPDHRKRHCCVRWQVFAAQPPSHLQCPSLITWDVQQLQVVARPAEHR